MKTQFILFLLLFVIGRVNSAQLYVETESFEEKGGWVVDQQFMEQVGSSYLMAHGMGKPVADAGTTVQFPKKGLYHVYVRTYNWTSVWSNKIGAGQFMLSVGDSDLPAVLGATGNKWEWQKAGTVVIDKLSQRLVLHDLTGFNGRCDAIYFSQEAITPPDDTEGLKFFLSESVKKVHINKKEGTFDFVVVGGGVAGMCAAVSAARLGLKVALINDRPVLGGNNSSEVRVHMGGRIELAPYPRLGNLMKEFCPLKEGNARPAENYEDAKKDAFIASEANISLFSSCRMTSLQKENNRIVSVTTTHIETGEQYTFHAPIFADCTGDGTVGYLAGADYKMGRESKSEFGEPHAIDTADSQVMGASVQWYSVDKKEPQDFPVFDYGLVFNEVSSEKVMMGEWTWETGMNRNQITEFERIRDYGLMVIFSNWSYLKNQYTDNEYCNRALEWVAYVAGKRESRRLLGDHILTENDLVDYIPYEDGTACTSWTIDLHYPDPENSRHFPQKEFKSIAEHVATYHYPIPYRCFYSRNIENLFMAGRNISVTHVALGTTRVMRTTGMIGEVVGMAASICVQERTTPRGVYLSYLNRLKELMKKGTGKDIPNNQQYNLGGTLGYKAGDSKTQSCE